MKVLFAASEAAPFVKVGGLGDVAGALPKALVPVGVDARVMIPLYAPVKAKYKDKLKFLGKTTVKLGWRDCYCGVFQYKDGGMTYYLIDNEQYFDRPKIYGEPDDIERFVYFSRAVLAAMPLIKFFPDVLHVNDWHTAMAPVYLNLQYKSDRMYAKIKSVLSIHNIEFQGRCDPYILGNVFGLDVVNRPLMEYDGAVNILKAGLQCADAITTVSKTYAGEILYPPHSFGLHHVLRSQKHKLTGIVNGIDTTLFDPQTDKALAANYSHSSLMKKTSCKRALQKEMALPPANVPLIGMVTRLTKQKGIDLLLEVMWKISGLDAQFVLLGTGDQYFEGALRHWEKYAHEKVRCVIAFSPEMSSKIYAASDLFLMPSRSEPCGLAQMIAMRYGSIPVVHAVGGLKDTVEPFDPAAKSGDGVTFQSADAYDMLDAVNRAIGIYNNKSQKSAIRKNAMAKDFSWDKPCREYVKVYEKLL